MRTARRGAALWAFLAVTMLPALARADGKMFSPVAVQVNIPDQSAILCFDGQTERLIISTAYEAPGTEFAWVVPTPAVPKVEAVTTGVIPTLRMFCRPKVVDLTQEDGIAFLLFVSALAICMAALTRRSIGLFAAMLSCSLLAGMVAPYFLRDYFSGRAHGVAGDAVTLHSEGRVGAYDVAVLSAATSEGLMQWLDANGYKVASAVGPVLAAYVREGWRFTAYKLHREVGDEGARAHPLSFTFPAAKAVYPMRLTGVGNGKLSLELFLLGEKEARLDGFERKRVMRLHEVKHLGILDEDGSVSLSHAGAVAILSPYATLTHLAAELRPEQMTQDLYPTWHEPKKYRPTLYTRRAAEGRAAAIAGGVAWLASALFMGFVAFRTHRGRLLRPMRLGHVLAFTLIATALVIVPILGGPWLERINRAFVEGTLPLYAGLIAMALVAATLFVLFFALRRKVPAPSPLCLFFLCAPLLPLALIAGGALMQWTSGLSLISPAAVLALTMVGFWYHTAAEDLVEPVSRRFRFRCLLAVLLMVAGTWVAARAVLMTRTPSKVLTGHHTQYHLEEALYFAAGARRGEAPDILHAPLPQARKAFRDAARALHATGVSNVYTGEMVREEDSPGNYVIEREGDRNVVYFHDIGGGRDQAHFMWDRVRR
jgi:hypothetical protein